MTNIANLLRNTKKGTILWSPLFGPVEFMQLGKNDQIWVRVDNSEPFDKYGRYFGSRFPEAECLLFPSNKVRTWEGWKAHIEPKFKVGDWIINRFRDICLITDIDLENGYYICESNRFGNTDGDIDLTDKAFRLWTIEDAKDGDVLVTTKIKSCPYIYRKTCYDDGYAYYYVGIDGGGDLSIAYPRKMRELYMGLIEDSIPATKEQRDLLFQKIKEAGYQWDDEKKELKKIPKHYDISNFSAGMPVLVRDSNNDEWSYLLFSHYSKKSPDHFFAGGYYWFECIPFEGNETLLGTTDMCDERFINW